ncbi:MAG: alpha/beta fold hydrolase [Clostridia bacterium]|nr:alpha/beta fold hydrolase [Clostridia bacterium]
MQRYFEINAEGHNVRCKLYYNDLRSIRRAVIFCHGFGGHKDNSAAEKFAERVLTKYKNVATVTFNWPCHGDDVKKKLRLADCDTYLRLVIAHVRESLGAESIYCYATSFGGYLALKYVKEHGNPFMKIALRCPAVNMYDVLTTAIMNEDDMVPLRKGKERMIGFDRKIPVDLPFLLELQENDVRAWDFLDYAEDIRILHGTADELVSFDEVQHFADEQLIEFVPVERADHRFKDPLKMELAMKSILDFYKL